MKDMIFDGGMSLNNDDDLRDASYFGRRRSTK